MTQINTDTETCVLVLKDFREGSAFLIALGGCLHAITKYVLPNSKLGGFQVPKKGIRLRMHSFLFWEILLCRTKKYISFLRR